VTYFRVNIAIAGVVIIFHKTVELIGYADDIKIMGRTKRVISDIYGELN